MKWVCFLIIAMLILPPRVLADGLALSGYSEAGKKSTAEDYEEEDEDNDYTFQNYHLKLGHKVSDRLNYNIGSFIYAKDYKSENSLDNISRIFNSSWIYCPKDSKEECVRVGLKLKYKEKRYDNTPKSEYDQARAVPSFTFTKKDFYTLNLAAGIDNFDYLRAGEKDQLKIFAEIQGKRHLLEKKLMLASSYKIEGTEERKVNRERTKHNIMGGFDYIFDLPWVYKITTRANFGQRDTKEEEERDEDYDYEYWRCYSKTEHRINPKLKAYLKYQYFKKDYLTADLDHRGFYLTNAWGYNCLDNKKNKVNLKLFAQHKDVEYNRKTGNNYRKETAEAKVTYQRKKNWEASLSLEGNCYDYNKPSRDKKRYYARLCGEKLFLEGDLVLSLELKYRYTDYQQKNNAGQGAVRFAFKYKF